MTISIQTYCDSNINWQQVADLLAFFGLSELDAKTQQTVFERSYAVVFLLEQGNIVGVGRVLSDGICQAAIYNIVVSKHLHGQGYGRLIIKTLMEKIKHCHVILYTHPKTVQWYKHLGFEQMKTGMARYHPDHVDMMREMEFI